LWHSPWIYRVMAERLTLYRTCVGWSRDSETVGEWAYTRAGCFSQATRRRHKSLLGPQRGTVEVERVEVVRGGGSWRGLPWWMVVFPGAAITVTILAVNLFGDALRDFLDPKLK
jgi:hypothetical protein